MNLKSCLHRVELINSTELSTLFLSELQFCRNSRTWRIEEQTGGHWCGACRSYYASMQFVAIGLKTSRSDWGATQKPDVNISTEVCWQAVSFLPLSANVFLRVKIAFWFAGKPQTTPHCEVIRSYSVIICRYDFQRDKNISLATCQRLLTKCLKLLRNHFFATPCKSMVDSLLVTRVRPII